MIYPILWFIKWIIFWYSLGIRVFQALDFSILYTVPVYKEYMTWFVIANFF